MFRTSRRFVAFTLVAAAFLACVRESNAQAGPVVTAINSYRSSKGLKTLPTNASLEKAAQKYAQFLANRDQTSAPDWHTLDGRSPGARASAEGYSAGVWENVQLNWGSADPAGEAMKWWKNSPGHNANMLNPGHTVMGVGAAKSASGKWFFVAMFGQAPAKVLPPSVPATTPPPTTTPSKLPSKTPTTELKKVTVRIENRSTSAMTFTIEGKSYTLQPGHWGSYWVSKVGDVHYGWAWTNPSGMGAAGGAGILQDRASYAFMLRGGSMQFMKIGEI